jgi:hypothetical protein
MSDPRDPNRSEPPIRGPQDAERFWAQYRRADSADLRHGDPASSAGDAHGRRDPGPRPAENGGGSGAAGHPHECLEWCPICRTAEVVRANASPELREQFQSLQKDALVAMRALLDAYLERLEHPERRGSSRVEDIPIA